MTPQNRPGSKPATSTAAAMNVAAMSIPQRIEISIRRAIPMLPAEARSLALSMISPTALKEIAATLVLWGASHLIGIGELADLVLLFAGTLMLGKTAVEAAKELLTFGSTILRATSPRDLDIAAEHFAKAVMLAGVAAVTAVLLRRAAPGRAAKGPSLTVEGAGGEAAETLYARTVKMLDLKVIKKLVIDAWHQPGKWPVKVVSLRTGQAVGDPVKVVGYITTDQCAAGLGLRELERRMGFASGYLGDAAAIVRLDVVPEASEFDVRFYNNVHGGGVKPPDARFPPGPGIPQWELLAKRDGHIVRIISK